MNILKISLLIAFSSLVLLGCGNRETSESTEPESTSLYAVGDNLIHTSIITNAEVAPGSYDFKPYYEHIANDIADADVSYINQETLIGGDHLGLGGYPQFNSPEDLAQDLADLDFNVITGGNNHTLDKGTAGVLNTVNIWDSVEGDFLFTGIFDSQEDRDTTPIYTKNGIDLAVLNYTYATNGIEPEEDYFVNYFDPELIAEDVERAKENSDFVIVAAHWGDENVHKINDMQANYAQHFADLGVDLVIGSHPHVIQPMEYVTGTNGNETLIVYSLGNLLNAQVPNANLLGGALELDIVQNGSSLEIQNPTIEPIVMHYNTDYYPNENYNPQDPNSSEMLSYNHGHKLYPLEEYTAELAANHGSNNFKDVPMSLDYLWNTYYSVIPEEFQV